MIYKYDIKAKRSQSDSNTKPDSIALKITDKKCFKEAKSKREILNKSI